MSAQTRSSAELVSLYLDAVKRQDAAVVDRYFHPDIEYVVNGTPAPEPGAVLPMISEQCRQALPWLGVHRGRQAVKDFLAHMHANLQVTAIETREVISEGANAAVFGWFRLHALATGRSVDIPFAIRVELCDGLIRKYHFLENTLDVAIAFRRSGEWQLETDGSQHQIPTA